MKRHEAMSSLTNAEILDMVRDRENDPSTVLHYIRANTRPGILRARRRSAWRARARRAWSARRFVIVPAAFAAIVVGFGLRFGLVGVLASLNGLTVALLVFALFTLWRDR